VTFAVGKLRWLEASPTYEALRTQLMLRAGFSDREVCIELKKRLGFAV
jgi:hypothetical protein